MTNIDPENMDSEIVPTEDEELTEEELADIREFEQQLNMGQLQDMEQTAQSEDEPIRYADELDIIAQYEGQIYEANKALAKAEYDLRMIKNNLRFDVEKEWKEKKTDTLSNDTLRTIETEKRIDKNEECEALKDKIAEITDLVTYGGIYKRNEERAFDALLKLSQVEQ